MRREIEREVRGRERVVEDAYRNREKRSGREREREKERERERGAVGERGRVRREIEREVRGRERGVEDAYRNIGIERKGTGKDII